MNKLTPNSDQLLSLLRTVLQILGTALVSHGVLGINGAMWENISGAILMIAPVIWGMFAHTDAAKVAAVVELAKQPDSPVQGVITTNTPEGVALAASIPGPIESSGTAAASSIAKP